MSLRPNFYGFDLTAMRRLWGSNDAQAERELHLLFDAEVQMHEPSAQTAGHDLIHRLISGDLIANPPATESELLQHVMNLFAGFRQDLLASKSIFWERFANDVIGRPTSGFERQLARYLTQGRPLLGERVETSWSFYAFLPNSQVDDFAAIVRHDRFRGAFDLDSPLPWLDEVERRNLDIWFFAY
jgi:hypothetical protein